MKTLVRILVIVILILGLGTWVWLQHLQHSYWDEPYSLIEDGLYLGSSVAKPPPGTKAVVNLCGREDPYTVDNQLWETILEGGKEPDLDWLKRVVDFIDQQRQAGVTTYVHCMAGVNRSCMVVTAYLMYKHHWPRDRALAFVQSKRPQVYPDSGLRRLLAEWEEQLRVQRATGGERSPLAPR